MRKYHMIPLHDTFTFTWAKEGSWDLNLPINGTLMFVPNVLFQKREFQFFTQQLMFHCRDVTVLSVNKACFTSSQRLISPKLLVHFCSRRVCVLTMRLD